MATTAKAACRRPAATQRLASASDEGEEDEGEGGESGVLGLAKARATPEARAERAAAHSVRGDVRLAEHEYAPGQRGALAAQGHFESYLERRSFGYAMLPRTPKPTPSGCPRTASKPLTVRTSIQDL